MDDRTQGPKPPPLPAAVPGASPGFVPPRVFYPTLWALIGFVGVSVGLGVAMALAAPGGAANSADVWKNTGLPPVLLVLLAFVPSHGTALLLFLGISILSAPWEGVSRPLGWGSAANRVGVGTFLAYWVVVELAVLGTSTASRAAFHWLHLPLSPPLPTLFAPGGRLGTAGWLAFAGCSVVLAPINEELLFRLGVYETLRSWRTRPAFWTSVLFAGFHFRADEFLPLFVLGYGLQKLRARAGGNLWPSILLHAGFNLVAVLAMWFFPG